MKEQTEDVLRQIDALLAKCATNKSRILSATVYVKDMKLKPEMDAAWLAWVDPENLPARDCAGRARLARYAGRDYVHCGEGAMKARFDVASKRERVHRSLLPSP